MKNTIETENGIITIIERYGKDFKIEMFDPHISNPNVLYAKYSSDYFVLKEEETVKKLFNELEPQIIQIMKIYVNENIEFYKHFDIDFTLIGDSLSYTSKELFGSNYFQ
jgi:elongation factor P--beta-lysine ligase